MKQFCRKHYLLAPLLASLAAGLCLSLAMSGMRGFFLLLYALPCGLLVAYPLVLTAIELYLLLRRPDGTLTAQAHFYDGITLILGVVYSLLFQTLAQCVVFSADWTEQLSNAEVHTPIASAYAPTIVALAYVAALGYFVLSYLPLNKLPPLVILFGISAMYLGCGVAIVWAVQVVTTLASACLALLPLNVTVITARTVREKIAEWKRLPQEGRVCRNPLMARIQRLLRRADCWPVLALVTALPLLGVLLAVLSLFGQSPSAAIRAWTETSDWNLSQRVAPQNVYYDEHYLCTVAAGGHKRLVKPLRLGVRHGHQVIVNRQLCIANAFEQILEERTPRFHRAVRHFYDTYGFPIARLIHSAWLADVIYVLMKPLEWFFLLTLYACDVHPEDRIAVQYTGKSVHAFEAE